MTECICGLDEPCPVICETHDVVGHGYPCGECQREWEQANPKKVAEIDRIIRSGQRAWERNKRDGGGNA